MLLSCWGVENILLLKTYKVPRLKNKRFINFADTLLIYFILFVFFTFFYFLQCVSDTRFLEISILTTYSDSLVFIFDIYFFRTIE